MNITALSIIACLATLVGCAAAPVPPIPAPLLWQDQVFNYDAALATITKRDLFALDADLQALLKGSRLERASAQVRVNRLTALIYGPRFGVNGSKGSVFPYQMGHSSIAAETWRRKRGDCLSLLVLTYAIAKAMDLPATMQEVRVPQIVDRYGGVDYVAGHVNLLIKNGGRLQISDGFNFGNVVIDFEPQIGSQREGSALTEDAILARFYNNLAAEYLAAGQLDFAYAHFKAAIAADASFSPSYANLALVYKRQGLLPYAERLLRHAIALDDDNDIALASLHRLLQSQGRDSEAAQYAKLLEARREKNPYYWFGLGLNYFHQEDYRRAIAAFEQAAALSTGFEEVHRYLALAYLHMGDAQAPKMQAALVTKLTVGIKPPSVPVDAMVARKRMKKLYVD